MNSNHCWVGAVFGIELMLVNLKNPNCPSAYDLKELSAYKHFELVLFTPQYTDFIITVYMFCRVSISFDSCLFYKVNLSCTLIKCNHLFFTHFLTLVLTVRLL